MKTERISINPKILGGKPCIAGTRIAVTTILELLEDGLSLMKLSTIIQTMFYEHWETDTPHAVVVIGMEPEQRFWIHDPELPNGPTAVSWNGLLATWQEFDFHGTVIRCK